MQPELSPAERSGTYIVIAAFNEASRIGPVLAELAEGYPNLVVVDDGSTDETGEVARSHGAWVLRHLINRGQGAALQTGLTFSLARGAQAVVTFDADGQHQVSDLPAMLRPIFDGECHLTLGSRFLSHTSNVPPVRRLLLKTARTLTWMLSGLRLTDCHNGLRALSRTAAERINIRQDRMAHASEIYDQVRHCGLTYKEVPTTVRYSEETLAKGQSAFNALNVMFHYLFGKLRR